MSPELAEFALHGGADQPQYAHDRPGSSQEQLQPAVQAQLRPVDPTLSGVPKPPAHTPCLITFRVPQGIPVSTGALSAIQQRRAFAQIC